MNLQKYNLKIYEGGCSTPAPRGVSYDTKTNAFALDEHYKVKIITKNSVELYGAIHVKTPGYMKTIKKEFGYCDSITDALIEINKKSKGLYENYFDFDKTIFELQQNDDYFYIDKEFKEIAKKIDEQENYKPLTAKTFLKYFEIEDKMKDYFMFQNI